MGSLSFLPGNLSDPGITLGFAVLRAGSLPAELPRKPRGHHAATLKVPVAAVGEGSQGYSS